MRKGAILIIAFMLSGCITSEFQTQRDNCTAMWMQKMPPRLEQEVFQNEKTRKIEMKTPVCREINNIVSCSEIERTENYTENVVRTVDGNMSVRDEKIAACTQNMCFEKFGTADCKAP